MGVACFWRPGFPRTRLPASLASAVVGVWLSLEAGAASATLGKNRGLAAGLVVHGVSGYMPIQLTPRILTRSRWKSSETSGAKTRRMCSSKAGSEKSDLTCPGFPPRREPMNRGQGYGKQKKPAASLRCFPSCNSSQRAMDLCSRLCTIWGQPGTPGPHTWVLLHPRTHAERHPESRQEPRGRSRE